MIHLGDFSPLRLIRYVFDNPRGVRDLGADGMVVQDVPYPAQIVPTTATVGGSQRVGYYCRSADVWVEVKDERNDSGHSQPAVYGGSW